jgi:hypothetical protein
LIGATPVPKPRLALYPILALFIACGGDLTGELTSADGFSKPFDVSGAAIAWIDASDGALHSFDSARLQILLTGLSFDPTDDLLGLSGSELADLQLRFVTHDAIGFLIPDAARTGGDQRLELTTVPNGSTCPTLNSVALGAEASVCLRVGPEPLAEGAGFDSFHATARLATVVLELDPGNRVIGETLSGTVTLTITQHEADPESALTGVIEGRFSTTLLGERLAERNMALLQGASP